MKVRKVPTPNPNRTIEWWYDRSAGVRSWVAILVDEDGNQVGDAIYVGTEREVRREVHRLWVEHGGTVDSVA